VPKLVVGLSNHSVRSVAAGYESSLALTSDGKVSHIVLI